jgi:hypothetical protein
MCRQGGRKRDIPVTGTSQTILGRQWTPGHAVRDRCSGDLITTHRSAIFLYFCPPLLDLSPPLDGRFAGNGRAPNSGRIGDGGNQGSQFFKAISNVASSVTKSRAGQNHLALLVDTPMVSAANPLADVFWHAIAGSDRPAQHHFRGDLVHSLSTWSAATDGTECEFPKGD